MWHVRRMRRDSAFTFALPIERDLRPCSLTETRRARWSGGPRLSWLQPMATGPTRLCGAQRPRSRRSGVGKPLSRRGCCRAAAGQDPALARAPAAPGDTADGDSEDRAGGSSQRHPLEPLDDGRSGGDLCFECGTHLGGGRVEAACIARVQGIERPGRSLPYFGRCDRRHTLPFERSVYIERRIR